MKSSPLPIVIALSLFSSLAWSATEAALDDEELAFLRIINEYREANGAPCLTPSPTMNAAADYMSRFMGEEGFFDHNEPPCDPTGDICTGRDPFDRITAFGHTEWSSAAENIAAGNPNAAQTFEQWKNSEGHNRNMLDPDFTSVGIGRVYVEASPFGWYWTNNYSNWVDGSGDCFGEGDPPPSDGDDSSGNTAATGGNAVDDGIEGSCSQAGGVLWWGLFVPVGIIRRRMLRKRSSGLQTFHGIL